MSDSGADDLWERLDVLLRRRPGWQVQPLSTPGGRPVWQFGADGAAILSVFVEENAFSLYGADSEVLAQIANVDELVEWLRAKLPGALQSKKPRLRDKVKSGRLFAWD